MEYAAEHKHTKQIGQALLKMLNARAAFSEAGDQTSAQALSVSHGALDIDTQAYYSETTALIVCRALCTVDAHGGDFVSAVHTIIGIL